MEINQSVFEDEDTSVSWLVWGPSFFSPRAKRVRVLVSHGVRESLEHHSKTNTAAASLMDLPAELLQAITEKVFKEWPRATVLMRVSKQMRTITKDVKSVMNSNAYAWWTGAAAPMSFDHSEADQIKRLNNTLQESSRSSRISTAWG